MSVPLWVSGRNGRLMPFEADHISRSLFAASEALNMPDAFKARELADAVVHFLSLENDDAICTSDQIAEMVIKVVRELGHPELARAFAQRKTHPPPDLKEAEAVSQSVFRFQPLAGESAWERFQRAGRAFLREYARARVFSRDIVHAERQGLLRLDEDAPLELLSCVLQQMPARNFAEDLLNFRACAGGYVVLDSPELVFSEEANSFARGLDIALRSTGLRAVVNLNCALFPKWAEELAPGPLFAGQGMPKRVNPNAEAIARELVSVRRAEVYWHMGERDFHEDALCRLPPARRITFVFDRPRSPVMLAPGTDRQHPAVLMRIELGLTALLSRLPHATDWRSVFLEKLASLANLAVSAALQKRDFLRGHVARLAEGFLLDRARLLLGVHAPAPFGLDAILDELANQGMLSRADVRSFEEQVVRRLQEIAVREKRLDVCVDCPLGPAPLPRAEQLARAHALHASCHSGVVYLPPDEEPAALLRRIWQRTAIQSVRFWDEDQSDRFLIGHESEDARW